MEFMGAVCVLRIYFSFICSLHHSESVYSKRRQPNSNRTCGESRQQFSRQCNNPKPQNGGKNCEGIGQEFRRTTPVPCYWSECSRLCHGTQKESAHCVDEANHSVSEKLCPDYQHHGNQRPCNMECMVA